MQIGQNMHMPALPRSNIHLDILMGRDELLDVADVFGGMFSNPSLEQQCLTTYFCRRRGGARDGHSRSDGTKAPDVIFVILL